MTYTLSIYSQRTGQIIREIDNIPNRAELAAAYDRERREYRPSLYAFNVTLTVVHHYTILGAFGPPVNGAEAAKDLWETYQRSIERGKIGPEPGRFELGTEV